MDLGTNGATVGDATDGDEELADGIEGAFAVESEIEVVISEDVDDVIDDWLRELCFLQKQNLTTNSALTDLTQILLQPRTCFTLALSDLISVFLLNLSFSHSVYIADVV